MRLEIDVEGWPGQDWRELASEAARAAAAGEPALANPRLEASILFTSDVEVHELNRGWREKDKPTNVLSFPMLERAELLELAPEGAPVLLGDIALAHETCAREAGEKRRLKRLGRRPSSHRSSPSWGNGRETIRAPCRWAKVWSVGGRRKQPTQKSSAFGRIPTTTSTNWLKGSLPCST